MVKSPTYLLIPVKSGIYKVAKPFEVRSSGMVIAAVTARRVNSVI